MHNLSAFLAFVVQHSGLAYGTVFLVALCESLALVGLVVPGTVIMFAIGAIVATGSLDLKPVLVTAAAGAIVGDGLSYWLGRRYREELRRWWPFSRYPGMLQTGEAFFQRHGSKSVLFGRFVGPVRPVIPLVAGMMGMKPLPFGIVNVLSAVGWAPAYILPGVLFGTSLAVAGAVSTRLAVLLFLVLAIFWAVVWLGRRVIAGIAHRGPRWIAALNAWLSADAIPARGIRRWLRRLLANLFYRQHGEELLFTILVLAFFLAVWGFLGVLQDVLAKDPLVLADRSVFHLFQALRTPWADRIFVALTELGDSFVNMCLFGAVLVLLLVKRCYRTAGFWGLAVLGGAAGVQLLKWSIHQPRPMALYHGASAYGFPSGHTTMSVILYGCIATMLVRGLPGNRRWGVFVVALLAVFTIAISRLYLGAHWLSAILGGFFIGTSWAALLGIAYLKNPDERVPRRLLGLVTVLVVVFAGSWHVIQRHERDLAFYAPQNEIRRLSLDTWLAGGWRDLPVWRTDMVGEREQPLTIQWAGQLEGLVPCLSSRGWRAPPAQSLKNWLGMLSPDTPVEALPVLPKLHSGRVDRLCLVRRDTDTRWVLRLWPSDIGITGAANPIFVGTVEIQKRRRLTWLISVAHDTGDFDQPRDVLVHMLQSRFQLRSVNRTTAEVHRNGTDDQMHWQGEVVLAWEAGGGAPDTNAVPDMNMRTQTVGRLSNYGPLPP